MPSPLSGPGVGLALPQNLYPTELQSAPYDFSTNRVALGPGEQLPIPAGTWYVGLGMYCVLQYLDPVTGTWALGSGAAYGSRGFVYVKSDGFNVRVANLTGCPAGAVIANAGAGYGVAPIVFIPAPAPASNNANGVGGIQASGYCGIASGTVSGFTFTNPGAGYATAPTPVVLPNPTDPNINTGITAATLSFSLVTGGGVTGCLCTNNGAALSNPNNFTLTVSGAGTNATVTGIAMQTITKASVTGGGTGYGTTSALLTTVGGVPPQGSITNNPDYLYLAWLPRPAQIGLSVTGTGTLSTQLGAIYDGGLFNTNAVPAFVISSIPQTA